MKKNWRPVSLLCVDYKIIAKNLSLRLKECNDRVVLVRHLVCLDNSRQFVFNLGHF